MSKLKLELNAKTNDSRLSLDQFKAKNSNITDLEKLTGGILGACHPGPTTTTTTTTTTTPDPSAEALNGLRGLMDWWK